MPTITKKQLEEYEQLHRDRDNGRLLTSDGLRFICEANNLDPEAIGKHILEVYGKFKSEKIFEYLKKSIDLPQGQCFIIGIVRRWHRGLQS